MSTFYSQGDGAFSTTTNWDTNRGGGGTDPASANEAGMAGHTFVIQPGHDIEFDMDMSGWSGTTGLYALTIEGHATDAPGMLYCKHSGAGTYHLMIQGGSTTANIIQGTNLTNLGRILANSDGVWANSTALPNDRKFIIEFRGTTAGKLIDQYLDVKLLCTQPTNTYVRTYGTKYDFNSATAVDTTNNTIDLGTTPPSADTAVMVIPASGATLPTPLDANHIYYVRAVSGNTCKLAYYSGSDTLIVDITAVGSGTCSLITGHTSTSTKTINILEDLSADTVWVTTAGHNRVALVDRMPENYDQQRDTLATIDTTDPYSLTLTTNNVDSAQGPGARIYLASRNVSIRSNTTSSSQPIIDSVNSNRLNGNIYQCEIVSLAGTGTTFYGYGINYGTGHTISGSMFGCANGIYSGIGHTISGSVFGCSSGINYGIGHTISGSVFGCSSGIYYGTGYTISGSVFGCSYGINSSIGHTISGFVFGCSSGVNSGIGHTISGSVFGCSTGINYGTGHTISGSIFGCSSGIYSGIGHTISGSIFGCNYGINYGTGHTISGKIGYDSSDVVKANITDFRFGISDTNALSIILRNAKIPSTPVFGSRNTAGIGSQGKQGVFSEDHGNVLGASCAYLPMGNVLKTAINSGGDAPTKNPDDAATGNCIEVSSVQSNCAANAPIEIFSNHRIYLTAGTYTITYKINTTYAGIAAGGLKLTARYISDDSPLAYAEEVENATAISERSGATDWSQTIAVTITTLASGWVDLKMELMEYESNNEVYVWPVPVIS